MTDGRPGAFTEVRNEIRGFLSRESMEHAFTPVSDSWLSAFDPRFSAALGARGWIGMTWPKQYGGRERSHAERFAVLEELVGWGAPVAAHWFADRQVGPSLLRLGTEDQKMRFLPEIIAGRCFFAIGLSEPNAGSDLSAIETRLRRSGDGWVISGSKIWTSHAHRVHHLVVLCRSSDATTEDRDMTQVIVDVPSKGLEIRPIRTIRGEEHFCEVFLDDVRVDASAILGVPGDGWRQTLTELADERSGPERYLSVMPLLRAWLRDAERSESLARETARVFARLAGVRSASRKVTNLLDQGESVAVQGALVKDVGTALEQDIVKLVVRHAQPSLESTQELLDSALARSPGFTIRGGASEVLRSIVARELP